MSLLKITFLAPCKSLSASITANYSASQQVGACLDLSLTFFQTMSNFNHSVTFWLANLLETLPCDNNKITVLFDKLIEDFRQQRFQAIEKIGVIRNNLIAVFFMAKFFAAAVFEMQSKFKHFLVFKGTVSLKTVYLNYSTQY
jgi:hypothetical protein